MGRRVLHKLTARRGPVAPVQAGFSLIELMVVIIVLGVLASVAMQSMTTVVENARVVKTKREMSQLAECIVGDPQLTDENARVDFGYVGDIGAFPPNLNALYQNPGSYSTWNGPYLPEGFTQDSIGLKTDEWGKPYAYTGGATISSTGSGSTITENIADATSDYLLNTFNGDILDLAGNPPGADYVDSVVIEITVPDGLGGTLTKDYHPSTIGNFKLDSIPVGVHPLELVYLPTADTLHRYLTIVPRQKSRQSYRFGRTYFVSGGGSGGGGGAPAVDTLINADFSTDEEGFTYSDDLFRSTSQPTYASGSRISGGGYSGAGLSTVVGGVNNNNITDMSGGWQIDFNLGASTYLTLSFWYNLTMASQYEADEYSQVLISIDGILHGNSPNDYVYQLTGTSGGGPPQSSGWQQFTVDIGPLSSGSHTLAIGAYNNKKNQTAEETQMVVDNVLLVTNP